MFTRIENADTSTTKEAYMIAIPTLFSKVEASTYTGVLLDWEATGTWSTDPNRVQLQELILETADR